MEAASKVRPSMTFILLFEIRVISRILSSAGEAKNKETISQIWNSFRSSDWTSIHRRISRGFSRCGSRCYNNSRELGAQCESAVNHVGFDRKFTCEIHHEQRRCHHFKCSLSERCVVNWRGDDFVFPAINSTYVVCSTIDLSARLRHLPSSVIRDSSTGEACAWMMSSVYGQVADWIKLYWAAVELSHPKN